jgi:hypothetical protein
MPKTRPVTDEQHVLSALGAAKAEGAKALLIEIGPDTISSIRIFLDDEYRRLLSDEEAVHYEFDPKTGRHRRLDAPH